MPFRIYNSHVILKAQYAWGMQNVNTTIITWHPLRLLLRPYDDDDDDGDDDDDDDDDDDHDDDHEDDDYKKATLAI